MQGTQNTDGGRTTTRKTLHKGRSDLRGLLIDSIKDGLERGLAEAALNASLLVVFISLAEPFWAEIEGISKRLVDTLERIPTSHEDLDRTISCVSKSSRPVGGMALFLDDGYSLVQRPSSMLEGG